MIRMTNAGTEYELASSAEGVPSAAVEKVIDAAAKGIGPGADRIFVADRNHGDVQSEGAWSLCLEGAYDWPFIVTAAERERRTVPTSLHLEVGAGWRLDVYPAA